MDPSAGVWTGADDFGAGRAYRQQIYDPANWHPGPANGDAVDLAWAKRLPRLLSPTQEFDDVGSREMVGPHTGNRMQAFAPPDPHCSHAYLERLGELYGGVVPMRLDPTQIVPARHYLASLRW
jgi:hypothetical protein